MKRILRLLVNWTLLLTLPVWGGLVLLVLFLGAVIGGELDPVKTALGRHWFWEEF